MAELDLEMATIPVDVAFDDDLVVGGARLVRRHIMQLTGFRWKAWALMNLKA